MLESSNPFDLVPYEAIGIPYTLPAHLALSSAWYGGPKPKVRAYRAIELGCGAGGNLIPMAYYQRDSRFVGVDYSKRHIECARETATELGLDNIQFELGDVCDLDKANREPFDYIIAHGLFSWIPEEARAAVLVFCRDHLSPNGIAYICYNTMPGWAMRGVVRDALRRSPSVQSADLKDQAIKAKQVAINLLNDLPSREHPFGALLGHELERIRGCAPYYIQHEYLAADNVPFWFADFVALANRYHLDYVAEALFCRSEGQMPQSIADALEKHGYPAVYREEVADLPGNRQMRTSILCHNDAQRSRVSRRELLNTVTIATVLRAKSDDVRLADGVFERFDGEGGIGVELDFSLSKAAVLILSAQLPLGLTFDELLKQSEKMLAESHIPLPPDATAKLAEEITSLFTFGQLHLRLVEPTKACPIEQYPVAHMLAQFEARNRKAQSTPHHIMLPNQEGVAELIRLLDGKHSLADLESMFGKRFAQDMIILFSRWGPLQNRKAPG